MIRQNNEHITVHRKILYDLERCVNAGISYLVSVAVNGLTPAHKRSGS